MNVKDLITKLQQMPQGAEVCYECTEGGREDNPDGIETMYTVRHAIWRGTGYYPYHDKYNLVILEGSFVKRAT
jgi:hypothetical protein